MLFRLNLDIPNLIMLPQDVEYYPDYGIIAVLICHEPYINFNYHLIQLYNLNLEHIYDIVPNNHDVDALAERRRFKLLLHYKSNSLIKNNKTKLKISFGYNLNEYGHYQRGFNKLASLDHDDINDILSIKNNNIKIIFNNKVIVRYDPNIIILIMLLKYILYLLPFDMQNEIFNIIYNLCVRSKLL